MGGTSADISLIENYKPQISNERNVDGFPARIPMINIVTIGAGGGSIAKVDEGKALKVGPESAGAVPGPACYNRGGMLPTVTDANIILGKLNQKKILGGRMELVIENAYAAIDEHITAKVGLNRPSAANGIISVVNSNMVRAIRSVSVERGYDVREFTLLAFGGAGPLHACEVADQLGIREVLIPPSPGTLCSLGLLMADTKFDLSQTKIMAGSASNLKEICRQFTELVEAGTALLDRERVPRERRCFTGSIDIRYVRQNFEINIPVPEGEMDEKKLDQVIAAFHKEHKRSYGYCNEKAPVQLINFRISAIGIIDKPSLAEMSRTRSAAEPKPFEKRRVLFQDQVEYIETGVYNRSDFKPGGSLEGPVILEQMDSTLIVPPNWKLNADNYGNLKLTREA
jgi:N-methylhydantoinase A